MSSYAASQNIHDRQLRDPHKPLPIEHFVKIPDVKALRIRFNDAHAPTGVKARTFKLGIGEDHKEQIKNQDLRYELYRTLGTVGDDQAIDAVSRQVGLEKHWADSAAPMSARKVWQLIEALKSQTQDTALARTLPQRMTTVTFAPDEQDTPQKSFESWPVLSRHSLPQHGLPQQGLSRACLPKHAQPQHALPQHAQPQHAQPQSWPKHNSPPPGPSASQRETGRGGAGAPAFTHAPAATGLSRSALEMKQVRDVLKRMVEQAVIEVGEMASAVDFTAPQRKIHQQLIAIHMSAWRGDKLPLGSRATYKAVMRLGAELRAYEAADAAYRQRYEALSTDELTAFRALLLPKFIQN